MPGEIIEFSANGNAVQGYLARSESGRGPGVIVIQEWWGLVDHIKDVCDRLAAEGFTALAPDFYGGVQTTEPDEAGSLMMALEIPKAAEVIKGAISAVQNDESTSTEEVGVIGFCMGGQLAMYAAAIDDRVGACVNFYGIHPNVKPPFEKMTSPILGIFAEHDEYASPDVVEQLSRELSSASVRHDFRTYEGAQHAFFNDDRPEVYNQESAQDAWERTLRFLRVELT